LAVGILVDDATVEIENMNRNIDMGKEIEHAILDGAQEIAAPAFVATLSICIVFVPMFLLTGVARYLFVPLAEAVVFAMLASYLLSRTLVPTMSKYLLTGHEHDVERHSLSSRNPFVRWQVRFEKGFERLRVGYRGVLERCLHHPRSFVAAFFIACLASIAVIVPWLGQDFFPSVDSGTFKLHVRAPTGTRIEETARLCDLVERSIRRQLPAGAVSTIIDNIGLPYSGLNLSYSDSAPVGTSDADIMVSLNERRHVTDKYVHDLRIGLAKQFPGVTFAFLPSDIVSQILNFGLPSPIDIQIVGNDLEGNHKYADTLLQQVRSVPGIADPRIQQPFDQPYMHLSVDRTKAQEIGYTAQDIAQNLLVSLSGSFQTSPTFWVDPKNRVSYQIATQTPQYRADSLQDLENIPVTGPDSPSSILANVGSVQRGTGVAVVSHYDIQPVLDIFGAIQGRDLGGVSRDINRIIETTRAQLPRGSQVVMRGQVQTMNASFIGLLEGLAFSIVLVYLLIVVNFQSWLDPFIIMTALPAALTGIVWCLFATHTTISVPALTGTIMCMGVATSNSILVVQFATERMGEGKDPLAAALEAGFTRFRPVLMTALAMIIGMVPMSLGLGDGGEQNAPLGRAVIGGLLFATVSTLLFVPTVFSILHGLRPRASEAGAPSQGI
jgi:multidrug efflux pump subunit AcrB